MQEKNDLTLLSDGMIINIHDGSISQQSILVEKGKIKLIGEREELAKYNASKEIDCEGKFVIPGLFDMHMHIAEEEVLNRKLDKLLLAGITQIRDMGGIADSILLAKEMIDSKDLEGPDIFMAAYTLDGAQSTDPFHYIVNDSTDIKILADDLLKHGAQFFKVHNYFPLGKFADLKKVSDELGFKVVGHIPVGLGLWDLDSAGMDGIEHINSLLSGIVLKENNGVDDLEAAFKALDSIYISDYSAYLVEHNIALTPTLFAMDDMYSDLEGEAAQEKGRRLMELFFKITRWMDQNGVMILAGTDRGTLNDKNINELQDELGILVKAGLSPWHALRTSTINPAVFLDMEDSYGSVETNKSADLVILNKDPLEDIENTKDVYLTIKGGVIYSPVGK